MTDVTPKPTPADVFGAIRTMNEALPLADRVFTIRDTEMRGDDGPRVQAWRFGLAVLDRAGLLKPPTAIMVVHQSAPPLLGVQRCSRCGAVLYDAKTSSGEPWRGRVRVFLGKPPLYVATMDEATCEVVPKEDVHGE